MRLKIETGRGGVILIPVSAAVFIVSSLVVSSCQYFTEPEPYVNTGTLPPTTVHKKATTFRNYSVDQQVVGTVGLAFVPDWGTSGTESVIVYVDSVRVGAMRHYPGDAAFTFSINTAAWPNGRHKFWLYTYKTPTVGDSLGILSLLYSSFYIYETSLIFDNTPPTAPANVVITLQNNRPNISWTPTSLSNFAAYIIQRDGNTIATIFSQTTSSCTDSATPDFYKGYYVVGVSNGPVVAYSPMCPCTKGQSLGLSFDAAIDNMADDQVVFNLSNNNLIAVSTQTHAVTHQCYNGHHGIWSKSYNSDTIYCWENPYLHAYPASTLSKSRTLEAPLINGWSATALAVGPGDTKYVALQNWSGRTLLYNCSTTVDGYFLKMMQATEFSHGVSWMSISPDDGTLLVNGNNSVASYFLNNDTATFVLQSTAQRIYNASFGADWRNSRIFVDLATNAGDKIAIMDTRTLQPTGTYGPPAANGQYTSISSYCVNSRNVFIAYSNPPFLAQYDIGSGQLVRSWTFQSGIQSLLGSANGRFLFACTSSDQWIVDLGGTSQ